jgi:hypothetical protein
MRAPRGFQLGILVIALMIGGCGQGSPDSSTIRFESPAVQANGVISPRVSCGAGTLWIPLKWGAVPSGTEELAVYIGRFKEAGEAGAHGVKVPFGALVSGIDPRVHGIAANTFPPEVVPAVFGPVSCPPVRKGQNILLEVFALDEEGSAPTSLGSGSAARLTEEALEVGRFAAGAEPETTLAEEALAVGSLTATYGPR